MIRRALYVNSPSIFDGKRARPQKTEKLLKGDRIVLFEIGARGGIHARWRPIQELLDVVGFEPDQSECALLNEKTKRSFVKTRYLPYALGKMQEHEVKFYTCKSPGNSSLYEPNQTFIKDFPYALKMTVVESTKLDVTTLDEVCKAEKLEPDFIKIDTQGAELDILMGGRNALKTTKFIELEVEFNPQYLNQPIFCDVDRFMRENEFVLLGLRRTNWRRINRLPNCRSPFGGQIIHGDAIYYNEKLLTQPKAWSFADLLKFLLVLSAYHQDDFMFFLLSSPHPAFEDLDDSERLALAKELKNKQKWFAKLLSRLIPYMVNHTVLRGLVDRFKNSDETDWHDPDFF